MEGSHTAMEAAKPSQAAAEVTTPAQTQNLKANADTVQSDLSTRPGSVLSSSDFSRPGSMSGSMSPAGGESGPVRNLLPTSLASQAREHEPPAYDGPSKEELLKMRGESVTPCYQPFTLYSKNLQQGATGKADAEHEGPLLVSSGHMQYLFDENNKRYLDGFGGICTVGVGHCHPHVREKLTEQTGKVWHTSALYLHQNVHEYSARMLDKLNATYEARKEEHARLQASGQRQAAFPEKLTRVYFVNSGSEANDMALQMARLTTGASEVIGVRNCYHGMGAGAGALTSHNNWKCDVPGQLSALKYTMNPDPLWGPFGGLRQGRVTSVRSREEKAGATGTDPHGKNHEMAARRYANELKQSIVLGTAGRVAAFFAEPIQGVGGTVELADGFLPLAYDIARQHGAVCISDEVQTGFGRLGSHFWGFEMRDVQPDIVVMAKSIGNGFPLGAVACTEAIAQKFFPGKLHFNTYGGNPMACAVGMAVLDVIEGEDLQRNCAVVGKRLLDGLESMAERNGWRLEDRLMSEQQEGQQDGTQNKLAIVDVRGRGLMIGVELAELCEEGAGNLGDRLQYKSAPAAACVGTVMDIARDHGLLVGKGGLYGNVFRLKPPMCWTLEDADFCLRVFETAFNMVLN